MNRRDFLTVLGGASALSIMNASSVSAAEPTTSLYVKGLVIVDFDDPDTLKLGFPKAPGHKATLAVLPHSGNKRTMTINGDGSVHAERLALTQPRIFVPEIVRMKEFYGDAIRSKVDNCPSVISIPYGAIRSITTDEVSASRYTFVRTDNGEEVQSFRPRQVAESIKIDLSSTGTLKVDNGKVSIPLGAARELRVEYAPVEENADTMDAYADHFFHYFAYVERPAALDFDVVPKKLNGRNASAPRIGNNFLAWTEWPYCFIVAVR
jgi:hypothetical protein